MSVPHWATASTHTHTHTHTHTRGHGVSSPPVSSRNDGAGQVQGEVEDCESSCFYCSGPETG